jgi:hypothetical protein
MENNLIFFHLYVNPQDKELSHYSMLYNCLETLENVSNDIDVVVYYATTLKDFKSYKHLDKFNLFTRFKNVNFIDSGYFDNKTQLYDIPDINKNYFDKIHGFFHKWFCLKNACSHGHNKILVLDSDIIFTKKINYLFSKYDTSNKVSYCLHEASGEFLINLLGKSACNGGQLLIDCELVLNNVNFFENCIINYIKMCRIAKKQLNPNEYDWFHYLIDQYVAYKTFLDMDVLFKNFEYEDIRYGCEPNTCYKENIVNYDLNIIDINPSIYHYISSNAFKFCKKELHTKNMRMKYINYLSNYYEQQN